ncbi:flagellar hook-associated protein FlgK [Phreatobacter sp. AB_2022a]|uniref:flagellar hook-associated protein FlgK n=1 Tax=Phreatobacter sp. AB_2022a TaxID=3003134 RepID=UPI002286FB05|nr:flagellar hook-associated protein FlgK [Phreatobacter sp. AB_2022a]MCZ0735557.1 flagellar hook-associated protein FlgK [Phreatobacter sp. AB_2022a]
MALSSALSNALSGLRFNSTAMALTSANIANASNSSYLRKTVDPITLLSGNQVGGVEAGTVRREFDAFIQRQLYSERSNGLYSSTRNTFLSRLDQAFGAPGSARALDTVMNNFATAFQTLQTSPESASARAGVINTATVLTQTLRNLSNTVQTMRQDAEQGLSDATRTLNGLLGDLQTMNERLRTTDKSDASRAGLLDQRDALVDQISQYVDVRVTYDSSDGVQLYGGNGFVLLSGTAPTLSFDARGQIGPANRYDPDPAKRTVGTITANVAGTSIDLVAQGVFKSGKIGALLELRDKSLVAAQDQLDQIAAGLAQALGTSSSSTPVSLTGPGPAQGFDTPLGPGLSDGDTVTVEATVNGVKQTFTFKRVDDLSVPISDSMSADPNDKVFRLTGNSAAGHASQMQAAIDAWASSNGAPAGAFQVSVSGGNLRVLADPSVAGAAVGAAKANVTAQSINGGGAALPFFVDQTAPGGLYSDRVTAGGAQLTGLASRIDLNPALKADPSGLVVMQTNPRTPDSDVTRPAFLNQALANAGRYFAPQAGIGSAQTPFQGSLLSYTRAVISAQSNEAATAKQLDEGQQVVVNQLQSRFDQSSAVNIDTEMTVLIQLQTSYGANARVMSAVREMFDILRQM